MTVDNEAIETISSMYNAENKTLKLTNLDVTGNISATGNLDVTGNISTDGILTANKLSISNGGNIYGKHGMI